MLFTVLTMIVVLVIVVIVIVIMVVVLYSGIVVVVVVIGCACNSSIGMVFTTQEVTSGLCFVAAAVVLHC